MKNPDKEQKGYGYFHLLIAFILGGLTILAIIYTIASHGHN